MDGVFETQPDRTDLPLVVMPVVIESMIGPFKQAQVISFVIFIVCLAGYFILRKRGKKIDRMA